MIINIPRDSKIFNLLNVMRFTEVYEKYKPVYDKKEDESHGLFGDIIKLPSGKTSAGLTFYYVTKTVMDTKANVKEFIIEQTQLNTFLINYVAENSLTNEQKQAVQHAVDKYLEPNLRLVFEQREVFQRQNSGKLKQFISSL